VLTREGYNWDVDKKQELNLPPGGGTLYAAQFGGVGFHSSLGDSTYASLQQNENSYTMNLVRCAHN